MNRKLALFIVAVVAAFTLPVLASDAAPIDGPTGAPGARGLAQAAVALAARNPVPGGGAIIGDIPGTVSDVLPIVTLQQKNVGIDFLVQEIETTPHTVEVGAGVLLTVQPGS